MLAPVCAIIWRLQTLHALPISFGKHHHGSKLQLLDSSKSHEILASVLPSHCQSSCAESTDSPALYSGMRLYSVKNFFRMMRNC